MLGLGQFPAGRAGWEPQPMGTLMDGVACSGTFHGLSHRLRLALASCFLCGCSAAFSWELGNVLEDTGAPLGPQAAMGPGNFLEGGNREVAETGMGCGRSQASLTLLLPRLILDSANFGHHGMVYGCCCLQVPYSFRSLRGFPKPLQALYAVSRIQDREPINSLFLGGLEGKITSTLKKIAWDRTVDIL